VTLPFLATIDAVAVGRRFRLYCIERRQVTELGARRRHDIVEEFDEMVCDAIESRADQLVAERYVCVYDDEAQEGNDEDEGEVAG
jgi:hypothetical protein